MKLTSPTDIRSLMEESGLSFNKSFGQNFLISDSIVDRIATECGASEEDGILEIGPGIGSLTEKLCEKYGKVVSVEIDKGLIPVLDKTVGHFENLTVINNDILKVDLQALVSEHFSGREITVCANLPYYITTPILMFLLESGIRFKAITVMVQKEVAERLASAPGCSLYGAVTASINRYGTVVRRFTVPAGNFLPAPKVDSSVISILPYEVRPYCVKDEAMLSKVISAAFSQRRKTLVNSLNTEFSHLGKEKIAECVASCGFDLNIRGEKLGITDFAKLSDSFSSLAL